LPRPRFCAWYDPRVSLKMNGHSVTDESQLIRKIDYAKRIGVSPSYVTHLVKTGKIPTHDGKIDPVEADAALKRNLSPAQSHESIVEIDRFKDEADYNALYIKSRALHEEEKARLAKLKADELSGSVLSADQVRLDFFDIAKTVGNAILAVPDRLANELSASTTPEHVHQVLSAELRRCLEDMAEHWSRKQRGSDD
jgi:phage terminase Nu1 subunit (DNA packaging protein)